MVLLKTFDCILYDLLATKVLDYGLSTDAIKFIYSYLKQRKIDVKK